jgi:hypothetical protein
VLLEVFQLVDLVLVRFGVPRLAGKRGIQLLQPFAGVLLGLVLERPDVDDV